jgi:peptidoglycan hydrolase-like protein with peptidoglycan-binding domain
MRYLLSNRSLGTIILAALAAGPWTVPAAGAQTPPPKNASTSSTTKHTSTSSSKSHKSSSKKSKRVKGQAAPTPERISEIQEALAKNGSYSGVPSGKLDDSTYDALRKFQAAQGLRVNGRIDAPTLQKLGLGSETAGLAAPTPPPNSANRLLTSRAQQEEQKDDN